MDLYQMKCVLTVARHNNFRKAAAELCMTPPSLSQRIKKVEDELGVDLFIRSTRSVRPTAAGDEFLVRARKVIANVAKMNKMMQKYADGTNGHLIIGCVPIMKESGMIHLIKLFIEKYPHISLEFYEAECYDLYPLLYSGKIDVLLSTAFDPAKPTNIKLKSYPLAEDEFVLVTSKKHRLANREVINLREASEEQFIPFSPASSLFRVTVDACRRAGFIPRFSACGTHHFNTALGLVAENTGIAMIPLEKVTRTQWRNISIHQLSPKIRRTLYLVIPCNAQSGMKPVVQNFERFMADCSVHLNYEECN